MKLLLYALLFFMVVFVVVGFTTTQITAPTSFTYQSVLGVNVSGGINASGFSFLSSNSSTNGMNITEDVVNVTILNHSGSPSDPYGILASSLSLVVNATNDTSTTQFWNFTASLTDERHWIKLNFTNVSRADDGSFGGATTSERIVQIDIQYDRIVLLNGAINFSTTGNINTTGSISASRGLFTGAAVEDDCSAGEFKLNTSDDDLCLCSSDGNWKCVAVT